MDDVYFIDPKAKGLKRAAVPQHLQCQEAHSGSMGGHFAGARVYKTLTRHWWWDTMYNNVHQYCKSCPECAIATGGSRPSKPLLSPIPVQRPFQIVGVYVMELPMTKRDNKYVVVFQDLFTKWPMVYPVPDQKSSRLLSLLVEEVILIFGVPEALLSDHGANLLSHLMLDICKLLGVRKLNTTAYHLQCDLAERFNWTLKMMLRKHASQMGNQWDHYLYGVLWAYRNTPHESTGEKPLYLLFGLDCCSPTEASLLPPSPIQLTDVKDYENVIVYGKEVSSDNAQKQYKNYDHLSHPIQYKIGEWILISFPQDETGKNRKLLVDEFKVTVKWVEWQLQQSYLPTVPASQAQWCLTRQEIRTLGGRHCKTVSIGMRH